MEVFLSMETNGDSQTCCAGRSSELSGGPLQGDFALPKVDRSPCQDEANELHELKLISDLEVLTNPERPRHPVQSVHSVLVVLSKGLEFEYVDVSNIFPFWSPSYSAGQLPQVLPKTTTWRLFRKRVNRRRVMALQTSFPTTIH